MHWEHHVLLHLIRVAPKHCVNLFLLFQYSMAPNATFDLDRKKISGIVLTSTENIKWLQEKEHVKLDKQKMKEERQRMKEKRAIIKAGLQMRGMQQYAR